MNTSKNTYLIYGIHPIDELSKTTGFYETDHLYTCLRKSNPRVQKMLHKARKSKASITLTSVKHLDTLTNAGKHQGIALRRIDRYPLEVLTTEELVRERHGIYILINHLNDPQNLGSIIRSMAAFGANGLILNKKGTPPIGQVVWKVSSGAIARIPVLWVSGILSFLKHLQSLQARKSYFLIGADPRGKVIHEADLRKVDFKNQKIFLLLGDEEKGIAKHLISELDLRLRIPYNSTMDSLNVGVAGGIFLYILSKYK